MRAALPARGDHCNDDIKISLYVLRGEVGERLSRRLRRLVAPEPPRQREPRGKRSRLPDLGEPGIGPFVARRHPRRAEKPIPQSRERAEILVEMALLERVVKAKEAVVGYRQPHHAEVEASRRMDQRRL